VLLHSSERGVDVVLGSALCERETAQFGRAASRLAPLGRFVAVAEGVEEGLLSARRGSISYCASRLDVLVARRPMRAKEVLAEAWAPIQAGGHLTGNEPQASIYPPSRLAEARAEAVGGETASRVLLDMTAEEEVLVTLSSDDQSTAAQGSSFGAPIEEGGLYVILVDGDSAESHPLAAALAAEVASGGGLSGGFELLGGGGHRICGAVHIALPAAAAGAGGFKEEQDSSSGRTYWLNHESGEVQHSY